MNGCPRCGECVDDCRCWRNARRRVTRTARDEDASFENVVSLFEGEGPDPVEHEHEDAQNGGDA